MIDQHGIDRCGFTEAQLRATYNRCRRPDWPNTFDAAMADPVIGRLIVMGARCVFPAIKRAGLPVARPIKPGGTVAAPTTPQRPTSPPAPRAWPFPTLRPGEVDRKRAAAGDVDKDIDPA